MTMSGALLRLAVLAALFGFLFGFDEGIIAGALPFIGKTFTLTPATEGFMASAVPLGAVAGVFIAALFSDRLGRKRVLLGCALMFVVGSLLCGFAGNLTTLTLARLLLGAAIGASSMAAPMFLAELAPASARGAVVSAYQLLITIGILVAYAVDLSLSGAQDWRLMLGLGVVPAAIALVGVLFSPESPRWLILKERHDEAHGVIATLQPHLEDHHVRATAKDIRESLAKAPAAPPWSAFLAADVRPIATFAIAMFLLQQLSGINAVLYYAPTIMSSVGITGVTSELTTTVGIGALNVVVTIIAMLVVDKMGRRPLILIGFAGAALALAMISISMATPTTKDSIVAVAGMFLFIAFFAIAIGPLPWLYMSELFPMRLKTRGMALAVTANWVMNFLVVFLFPVVVAALGDTVTFGIFASFCVIGLVYAYKAAPETKGVPLEAMEREA